MGTGSRSTEPSRTLATRSSGDRELIHLLRTIDGLEMLYNVNTLPAELTITGSVGTHDFVDYLPIEVLLRFRDENGTQRTVRSNDLVFRR